VTIRLTDGQELREWKALVGWAPAMNPKTRGLLGFAGFLQYFDVLFRGSQEVVELTINDKYPGT
jgi:hypothetical protein